MPAVSTPCSRSKARSRRASLSAPISTRDDLNGIAQGPCEAAPMVGASEAAREVSGAPVRVGTTRVLIVGRSLAPRRNGEPGSKAYRSDVRTRPTPR